MPLKSEFMARGMSAGEASLIGQDPASTGLTAAGSTQATAFAIVSSFSIFGTAAGSTGAILPNAPGIFFVANNGTGQTITLYPPVGGNINGGTLNASISIPNNKSAIAISNGLTWGVNISA